MSVTNRVFLPTFLLSLLACLAVSSPALASEPCPNAQARSESNVNPSTGRPYSTQLPDCRAYELVSPPNTGGKPAPALAEEDEDGHSLIVTPKGQVLFASLASPPETGAIKNGSYTGVFRSQRTSDGWDTRDLTATEAGGSFFLEAVAADGSSVLVLTSVALTPEDHVNPTADPTKGYVLYVVSETAAPEFVSHGELPSTGIGAENHLYSVPELGSTVFANADLSAVGFESDIPLELGDPGPVVNRRPSCYVWQHTGLSLAHLTNPGGVCGYLAVLADGRPLVEVEGRIYAPATGEYFGQNYELISGPTPYETTFDGLAPNGETVYITTTDKLSPSADSDTGADLYAVEPSLPDFGSPAKICISCDASGEPGKPNEAAAHYVGQSADGSHVFFTVTGALYEHDAAGTQELAPASDAVTKLVSSENGKYVATETSKGVEEFAGDTPSVAVAGCGTPAAVTNSGQRIVCEIGATSTPGVINEWANGTVTQVSPLGATSTYEKADTVGPELEDVFFEAHEPLVGRDENAGTTDIYDARVDGGFPALAASPSQAQTLNPAPPATTPYSANLTSSALQLAPLGPDTSTAPASTKPKLLTRAQELAKVLKTCKRDTSKSKRTACEKTARKKYAAKKKVTK